MRKRLYKVGDIVLDINSTWTDSKKLYGVIEEIYTDSRAEFLGKDYLVFYLDLQGFCLQNENQIRLVHSCLKKGSKIRNILNGRHGIILKVPDRVRKYKIKFKWRKEPIFVNYDEIIEDY